MIEMGVRKMGHKILRLLCTVLIFLFTAFGTICPVSAQGTSISGRTGSITMTLAFDENSDHALHPVTGAEISIYLVADIKLDENGNEIFSYTPAFHSAAMDLGDLKADGLVNCLCDHIAKNNIAPLASHSTSSCGIVEFRDLSLGLYLVQMTKQDPEHHLMEEFLVSLPMQAEDGGKIYDVNATPKLHVTQGTTQLCVKKLWRNDWETDRPQSVTVELLGNGLPADTAVLTKENNWCCTFQSLPKEIRWTVREKDIPAGYECTVKGPDWQEGVPTITITNTKKVPFVPLIQTGQLNWPIPLLTLAGLWLMAAGWLFCRKKESERNRSAVRSPLVLAGAFLLAGGVFLYAVNQKASRTAASLSADFLLQVQTSLLENAQEPGKIPAAQPYGNPYDQQADSQLPPQTPNKQIGGHSALGVLSIPDLKLRLPVFSDWSYPQLKIAPCRHMGAVSSNDLVIAGHNYRTHFGRLHQLKPGAAVQFVDMNGAAHHYTVSVIQVIAPTDLDAVASEELDLVLYTCTYSGKGRLMIGCRRTEDSF